MQKPSRLIRWFNLAAVKTLPVEPCPHAVLAFDAKVIARELVAAFVAPPFHGDAFGTLGLQHFVLHLPPPEARRWAIGHLVDDLDRFRPLEQPDRAGGRERV